MRVGCGLGVRGKGLNSTFAAFDVAIMTLEIYLKPNQQKLELRVGNGKGKLQLTCPKGFDRQCN